MRPEQNHAGRSVTREGQDPTEVEIVGQQDEAVLTRPLEELPVGCRTVADGAPVQASIPASASASIH